MNSRVELRKSSKKPDFTHLDAKKATFLKSLTKVNNTHLHDFDSLLIIPVSLLEHHGKLRIPKGVQAVYIGTTGQEKVKRNNRKETRRLYSSKPSLDTLLSDHIKEIEGSDLDQASSPDAYAQPNYFSCMVSPPKYPPRKFCSVCAYPSSGRCPICFELCCSSECMTLHNETRCRRF